VRHAFLPSIDESQRRFLATILVGVGLATLIVSSGWSGAPVLTAMAIIALGATEITSARFQGTNALLPVMSVHAVVYCWLYLLFVGGTLHAASVTSTAGLSIWKVLDLAASLLIAAIAALRILSSLRHSILSRP
jgi:hypothetical protein